MNTQARDAHGRFAGVSSAKTGTKAGNAKHSAINALICVLECPDIASAAKAELAAILVVAMHPPQAAVAPLAAARSAPAPQTPSRSRPPQRAAPTHSRRAAPS